MSWLDRAKWKLDAVADDPMLSAMGRSLLLHAASLVDRLEQVDSDLASSSPDARQLFFRTATELRRLLVAIERSQRHAA
jgi:hypothetical protein